MFALQNAPLPTLRGAGLELEVLDTASGTAKFDLTLFAIEEREGLRLLIEYATDLFDAATIDRMLGHLETLLRSIVAETDRPIGSLPMLTEEERRYLLGPSDDPGADGLFGEEPDSLLRDSAPREGSPMYSASRGAAVEAPASARPRSVAAMPAYVCVHRLFETQAERTPGAIALTSGDQALTYRDLDARANRLAHHLRDLGVGPESLVGVALDRSPDLVVGLLAVLKTGGAYVPLDPAYPADRIAFMLDDAGAGVLLTRSGLLDHLSPHEARSVCVDRDSDAIAARPATRPEGGATLDNLAYVIYTSGSTGRPKGAMIVHRGLSNYLAWAAGLPGCRGDRGPGPFLGRVRPDGDEPVPAAAHRRPG